MKHFFIILFFVLFLALPAEDSCAYDLKFNIFDVKLWRHSEIADKNAVFVDGSAATLTFENFDWAFLPVDIRLEYILPLPLPISLGLFFKTPLPNFKSFGARLGYHIDTNNPRFDLFFVYSFDFGFLRNDILEAHNDTAVPLNFYDFRFGLRYFFGFLGLGIESGFKFENIIFFISIKLN